MNAKQILENLRFSSSRAVQKAKSELGMNPAYKTEEILSGVYEQAVIDISKALEGANPKEALEAIRIYQGRQ